MYSKTYCGNLATSVLQYVLLTLIHSPKVCVPNTLAALGNTIYVMKICMWMARSVISLPLCIVKYSKYLHSRWLLAQLASVPRLVP